MKKLAIIGSGDLGQQIAAYIAQDSPNKVIGYYDDTKEKGIFINKIPVLGSLQEIKGNLGNGIFDELVVAIGYKHLEKKAEIYAMLQNLGAIFFTFIHSKAFVNPSAVIGTGTIIFPGCNIDQNVIIGNNVFLNLNCTISHDSIIGDNTFIAPAVAIAGFTKIGKKNMIGINATISDHVKIADSVVIGAGAVVIRDILLKGTYVGNPSKLLTQ